MVSGARTLLRVTSSLGVLFLYPWRQRSRIPLSSAWRPKTWGLGNLPDVATLAVTLGKRSQVQFEESHSTWCFSLAPHLQEEDSFPLDKREHAGVAPTALGGGGGRRRGEKIPPPPPSSIGHVVALLAPWWKWTWSTQKLRSCKNTWLFLSLLRRRTRRRRSYQRRRSSRLNYIDKGPGSSLQLTHPSENSGGWKRRHGCERGPRLKQDL